MRDTQLKMTYGNHSVYSEPFSVTPPPSPEVLDNIQDDLNKRFVNQVDIPIGAEIVCEFVEATQLTGFYGFMGIVVEDTNNAQEA